MKYFNIKNDWNKIVDWCKKNNPSGLLMQHILDYKSGIIPPELECEFTTNTYICINQEKSGTSYWMQNIIFNK